MRRLIWAFVVRMWHKTRFRMAYPIGCDKNTCRQWKIETVWANAWQNQQNDVLSAKTDQPVYPSSLIRVLAVRMKKPWILSYLCSAKRRFEWGWADALAVLSLRCVHRSLCPQLQRSWRGILVSGCPLRSTRTVHARALKFQIGIPHGKITDQYFFLSELSPFLELCPFEKNQNEILSARYLKMYLS